MKTIDFSKLQLNSATKITDLGVLVNTYYQGSDKLAYQMFVDGVSLFTGDDYRPSPMVGIETLQSTLDLLGFLTVGEFDTDAEYFANYTDAQMIWAKGSGIRESLQLLISDLEDIDGEYYAEALVRTEHTEY